MNSLPMPDARYYLVIIPFVGETSEVVFEFAEELVQRMLLLEQAKLDGRFKGIYLSYYGVRIGVGEAKVALQVKLPQLGVVEAEIDIPDKQIIAEDAVNEAPPEAEM